MKVRTHSREFASLFMIAKTLLLLVPLMLATPGKASAYTDPGTGAFLYQAAYAAFLGGSFYLRKLLDRFLKRHQPILVPSATVKESNLNHKQDATGASA